MKPYDNTCVIRIADILAYRPPDITDALGCPPARPTPLTWQEVVRIAYDRLRSSWAAMRTFAVLTWAMGVTTEDIAERTVTMVIPAVTATPETRRRHIVAITAMVVMALLVALSLGMTAPPALAQASVVTTHVTPRLTVFHCVTVQGAQVCRMTSNNWGYCSKIHYPQQDKHCKTLLPPKGEGK